ncbi:MAG: hypothetical protein GKR94_22255 [Gammaproteobacteria bacterium]|nr:hypothetical protein [Gammaproteobacteria bacterium]
MAIYGVLFAGGMFVTSGAAQWTVYGVVTGFEALARAQYRLHLAAQNINAEGRAEYAVFLRGSGAGQELERWAARYDSLRVRISSLPGWRIVELPPDSSGDLLAALRAQPFAGAVLRNRGIWICH